VNDLAACTSWLSTAWKRVALYNQRCLCLEWLVDEVAAGVVPLWSDCVVNFKSPIEQTYAAMPIAAADADVYQWWSCRPRVQRLSWFAPKVYRIGCTTSNSSNDAGA
jgi:hypothetical protein